jgi:hypothetical protein
MTTQLGPDKNNNHVVKIQEYGKLITDHYSSQKRHDFINQEKIHKQIRNDEDYNDWDYGTEPTYGRYW